MPQAQAANPIINFIPLFFIFFIFYFLLIRPQKRKEKEHLKMIDGLAKNDEIVSTSGIHGTIVNVKDKTIIVRIDENVKIEMEKNCVAYKKKEQQETKGS